MKFLKTTDKTTKSDFKSTYITLVVRWQVTLYKLWWWRYKCKCLKFKRCRYNMSYMFCPVNYIFICLCSRYECTMHTMSMQLQSSHPNQHSYSATCLYTYHWSFRMSKQIAPVTELMLGCQIFVMNRTWQAKLSWHIRCIKFHVVFFFNKFHVVWSCVLSVYWTDN